MGDHQPVCMTKTRGKGIDMNNGADFDTPGQSAGVLPFPQQMSLFDDAEAGERADLAIAAGPVEPAAIRVPERDTDMACRTTGHLNMWTDERFFADLAPICNACPFRQWCAGRALEQSRQFHLVGMWAGVDFSETDKSGRYRRRIDKLEYIAATGLTPKTRRNKKPAAA